MTTMSIHQGPSISVSTTLSITSNIVTAVSGIICVSLIVRKLGAEQYGLFALQQTMLAMARALDFGLPSFATRGIASARHRGSSLSHLVNTHWRALLTACAATLIMLGIIPLITWNKYATTNTIASTSIKASLLITSVTCGVSAFSSYLQACALGHPRIIPLYLLRILEAISIAVACYVVATRRESLVIFTISQGAITLVYAIAYFTLMASQAAAYEMSIKDSNTGEAAMSDGSLLGLAALNFLSITAATVDRIILGAFLPFEQFSKYALASQAVTAVFAVFSPTLSAVFLPRISATALTDARKTEHYVVTTTIFAAAMCTITVSAIIVVGDSLLLYWTKSPLHVDNIYRYLSVTLSLGHSAGIIAIGPMMLCIARNMTRPPLFSLIIVYGTSFPLLVYACLSHGSIGAATMFMLASFLTAILLHRTAAKILSHAHTRRLLELATSFTICIAVAFSSRQMIPTTASIAERLCCATLVAAFSFIIFFAKYRHQINHQSGEE
jgi:O-antigen/teichoic acid export membrane protein